LANIRSVASKSSQQYCVCSVETASELDSGQSLHPNVTLVV